MATAVEAARVEALAEGERAAAPALEAASARAAALEARVSEVESAHEAEAVAAAPPHGRLWCGVGGGRVGARKSRSVRRASEPKPRLRAPSSPPET